MSRQSKQPAISNRGTARQDRLARALLPTHFQVEERTMADWLAYLQGFARLIEYVDDKNQSRGDWQAFFQRDISFFLAAVLSYDLSGLEQRVITLLQKSNYQVSPEDQLQISQDLLGELIDALLAINFWYTQSGKLFGWAPADRFEQEVGRSIDEELASILFKLENMIRQLGELDFPDKQDDLIKQLEAFDDSWAYTPDLEEDQDKDTTSPEKEPELQDHAHNISGQLRFFYQRIYYHLNYLLQTAERSFQRSLTHKEDHEPHIGLLLAFLKMYEHPRDHLNEFTKNHLDYYYTELLKQQKREGVPDTTFVKISLAEHLSHYRLPQGTLINADINSEGLLSNYQTDQALSLTRASLAVVKTLYVAHDPSFGIPSPYQLISNIYAAPVANSSDGLGAPFDELDPTWPPFGEEQADKAQIERRMHFARIGFVLASPTFLLAEGERSIELSLQLNPVGLKRFHRLLSGIYISENELDIQVEQLDLEEHWDGLSNCFLRYFGQSFILNGSGLEGWFPLPLYQTFGPEDAKDDCIRIQINLSADAPALVPQVPDLLGEDYVTPWPVIKFELDQENPFFAYSLWRRLTFEKVDIKVSVKGLTSLSLYNNLGPLDSASPFLPFGPLPRLGDYLLIGHTELFNKRLSALQFHLRWGRLPRIEGGFTAYYDGYEEEIDNGSFQVGLNVLAGYEFLPAIEEIDERHPLFTDENEEEPALRERKKLTVDLEPLPIQPRYHLLELPEYTNQSETGFFRLELTAPEMVFGHEAYPELFTRALIENTQPVRKGLFGKKKEGTPIPLEPFTPSLQKVVADYEAEATIHLEPFSFRENDQQAADKIVQLLPFGQKTLFADGKAIDQTLVPDYSYDGYLYLGLQDAKAGQVLSLFFRMRESRKEVIQQPLLLRWSYLRKNEWHPIKKEQILSDTTIQFTTTGIIRLMLPTDIGLSGSILENDLKWLRVAAEGNLDIIGRVLHADTQVVPVSWVNNGDPTHFAPRYERPPLKELVQTMPEVAAIEQVAPYSTIIPPETDEKLYLRTSERLRHKNRAITRWDYERLLLEQFPAIQQVKCIGQLAHEHHLNPGELRIILIPRVNPGDLEPRFGFHDLQQMQAAVEALASPFTQITLSNPVFERIKVRCRVLLKAAFQEEAGAYLQRLQEELKAFICPWIQGGTVNLGGALSKSDVLQFIQDRDYIQFVTGFSLIQIYEDGLKEYTLADTARDTDLDIIQATQPWSVLIPVKDHEIELLQQSDFQDPEAAAYTNMQLGTDFIVLENEEADEEESRFAGAPSPEEEEEYINLAFIENMRQDEKE